MITVKELSEKLRLVKDKETKVIFKTGNFILEPEFLAEVIQEKDAVRYPQLGESPNVLLVKLTDTPEVKSE